MATTPESFVDALNSAFGKQTTQRSAHAKGVVLLGKFVPSAEAASVSRALHFKHEVPVTVRFSANSGIPKIADADPRAAPRGLAIRFRLPDGSDTDLVMHSYNGFPAKNPEEFQQFFLAIAGSKPGVPSPTPIEAFQETHPAAKTFLTTRDPPPVSYATTTYLTFSADRMLCCTTARRAAWLAIASAHRLDKTINQRRWHAHERRVVGGQLGSLSKRCSFHRQKTRVAFVASYLDGSAVRSGEPVARMPSAGISNFQASAFFV